MEHKRLPFAMITIFYSLSDHFHFALIWFAYTSPQELYDSWSNLASMGSYSLHILSHFSRASFNQGQFQHLPTRNMSYKPSQPGWILVYYHKKQHQANQSFISLYVNSKLISHLCIIMTVTAIKDLITTRRSNAAPSAIVRTSAKKSILIQTR